MNTETHIIDFFKREFRSLSAKKKRAQSFSKPPRENHPLNVQIRTTYNIACEVLGSHVAGQMADDYQL